MAKRKKGKRGAKTRNVAKHQNAAPVPTAPLTLPELAVELKVGKATVYRWKSAGMPVDVENRITLADAQAWREQHGDPRSNRNPEALEETETLDDDLDEIGTRSREASARYREAKAEQEEIRLDELKGKVIPTEEIEGEFVKRALWLKQGLEDISTKLPGSLVGKDAAQIRALLRNAFRQLLADYTRKPKVVDNPEMVQGGRAIVRRRSK